MYHSGLVLSPIKRRVPTISPMGIALLLEKHALGRQGTGPRQRAVGRGRPLWAETVITPFPAPCWPFLRKSSGAPVVFECLVPTATASLGSRRMSPILEKQGWKA